MKSYLILEPSAGLLYLLNEQGQIQHFDLTQGLTISQQNGQLSIGALIPFAPDLVLRSLTLNPTEAHFNLNFDAQVQVLSIILTPILPSASSALAGGGKMKLGSVDLTLSRNFLTTSTTNLGAKEEAGVPALENTASQLEWYLLDLNQFNLVIEVEAGNLKLSTLPVSAGELA